MFLGNRLALALHPKKTSIGKLSCGIDFLGYVVFSRHRLIRTKTRRRIFKKFKEKIMACRAGLISRDTLASSLQSYLGVLSHAHAHHLAGKNS